MSLTDTDEQKEYKALSTLFRRGILTAPTAVSRLRELEKKHGNGPTQHAGLAQDATQIKTIQPERPAVRVAPPKQTHAQEVDVVQPMFVFNGGIKSASPATPAAAAAPQQPKAKTSTPTSTAAIQQSAQNLELQAALKLAREMAASFKSTGGKQAQYQKSSRTAASTRGHPSPSKRPSAPALPSRQAITVTKQPAVPNTRVVPVAVPATSTDEWQVKLTDAMSILSMGSESLSTSASKAKGPVKALLSDITNGAQPSGATRVAAPVAASKPSPVKRTIGAKPIAQLASQPPRPATVDATSDRLQELEAEVLRLRMRIKELENTIDHKHLGGDELFAPFTVTLRYPDDRTGKIQTWAAMPVNDFLSRALASVNKQMSSDFVLNLTYGGKPMGHLSYIGEYDVKPEVELRMTAVRMTVP